jgi:hypothetical protein
MKKITLFLFILSLPSASAFASDYYVGGGYYETTASECDKSAVYKELDKATREGRAVTTVVKCSAAAPKPAQVVVNQRRKVEAACGGECGSPVEKVTNREYYVRETREVYKPVVSYVSVGTYTTTRKVCESDLGC